MNYLFRAGAIEKAKLLIKYGMDVNFVDPTAPTASTSPFRALTWDKDISIEAFNSLIGLMKEHGLKMDQPYFSYLNPITSIEKAKLLIEHGIDLNFVDPTEAPFSSYQDIFSNHPTLMGALHEAIIFGHNMVTTPENNDHKTKAAITIHRYKLGDKKALDKGIMECEGALDLCKDYISPFSYCPMMIKGVNLGDATHRLNPDEVSLIFAYSTLRDFVSWARGGLTLLILPPEQDVLGLLPHEQGLQTLMLERHELGLSGDEIPQGDDL